VEPSTEPGQQTSLRFLTPSQDCWTFIQKISLDCLQRGQVLEDISGPSVHGKASWVPQRPFYHRERALKAEQRAGRAGRVVLRGCGEKRAEW
jgi:hypothetical protein